MVSAISFFWKEVVKMIKLIACDLDDTLLDRNSRISFENKQVIGQALAQGLTFTLATGRMFQSAAPFARSLGLDAQQPLVCYNGALIKRLSGETLYHDPLPTDVARLIAAHAQANGWTLNVYYDDEVYVARWNQQIAEYAELVQADVRVVGDLVRFLEEGNKEPSKMLITNPPEEVPQRISEIRSLVGDRIQIARSRKRLIEITGGDVHKGKALLWLAEFLGFAPTEVMAIGDSNNDQTMLEMAGLGVAMGNAPPEIKRAADCETLSNDEHGVALAISRLVLAQAEPDGSRSRKKLSCEKN